ncbi:AMP-binding protein [Paraburkholderia phymatum]|uniref:AMP-dependent synthetase and ligase n=1 Tax=Paraburkholderia phymatum (strain DSM 17167 / CIP 108236 / LMG 21445 / STM815) TaxID=391038 RepID=B2JSF6_PARP8|nr:AMP-binding protein [Paraburkholderia phymatum]ACC73976.1 AMP-dependent synthetase and ligase [Paraburkholderia phymatum STM815]
MEQSVGALITSSARKFGDKTALVIGGESWSFLQLDCFSSNVAKSLEQRGVGKGSVVSLYSPNCAQWIIAYYAILKLGAVVNPLNLMLTSSEAAYAVSDCKAVAVLGSLEKLVPLREALGINQVRLISFGTATGSIECFNDLLSGDGTDHYPVSAIELDDLCTIGYTSGTTGHPKGAMLSHRAILLNTAMTSTYHVRTDRDIVVSALPCSHVYGNIVMNCAVACGMTLVLHAVFDAKAILASIEAYRATIFEGVPTMYMYLLNLPELADYDVSTLTRCTVGGQTMPPQKMEEVERKFGSPLLELWGMTELGGLGATHPLYGPKKNGSIGVPLPLLKARIASLESPSKEVTAREVGELQMKGPITMMGYYGRPEATLETIDADGWLHTGDLAYIDEEGFIFIVDRLKDMVITGGFNIYPAELERVLCEHPSIALAAVVGVPDDIKGELAKAFIVRKHGAEIRTEDVFEFCRQRLAAYKVPRLIEFVEDLPKTNSGKILRRELRKKALQ